MSIFKVGDRVYDGVGQKWGTIISINSDKCFAIEIKFTDLNFPAYYTNDGRRSPTGVKRISFTEYDFVNGGFSQERPKPKIDIGQAIWVRDPVLVDLSDKFIGWRISFFGRFDNDGIRTQFGSFYNEYSVNMPDEVNINLECFKQKI